MRLVRICLAKTQFSDCIGRCTKESALYAYADDVRIWVYEEILPNGEKLSKTINEANVRNKA